MLKLSKQVNPPVFPSGKKTQTTQENRYTTQWAGSIALPDWQCFSIVTKMNKIDAVATLAALAQDTRLAIFRLLVRNEPAGLTAGVIAEQLELPAPTLSFHIKTLTHAGLVNTTQEGRFVRCHAEMGRIDGLIAFLTDNCCGGRPEICAPRGN